MRLMKPIFTSDLFLKTGSGTVLHVWDFEYPRINRQNFKCKEVFCKETGKIVLRIEENVFDEIKNDLENFLEPIFSVISVQKAIPKSEYFIEITHAAVKKCRKAGLENTGLISGSILLAWSGPHHSYSDDKFVGFVNRHEEMVNAATFDTVDKILAAFNPLRARLGFDNYMLTDQVDFSEEQLEVFKKDGELLNFLKRHLAISSLRNNDSSHPIKHQLMSELNPSELFGKVKGKSFEILKDFFLLPVQDKTYRDYLMTLTVGEYLVVRDQKIATVHPALAVEVSQYLIDSAAFARTVEGVRSAHELYFMIFDSCLTTGVSNFDIEQHHKWLLNNAPEKPATVQFMKDLINDENAVEEPCIIFKNLLGTMYPRNTKWVDSFELFDFVISKLTSEVGVHNTLDVIQYVIESGETISVNQWVEVSKNFGLFIDVPVSWWVSLLEEKSEK